MPASASAQGESRPSYQIAAVIDTVEQSSMYRNPFRSPTGRVLRLGRSCFACHRLRSVACRSHAPLRRIRAARRRSPAGSSRSRSNLRSSPATTRVNIAFVVMVPRRSGRLGLTFRGRHPGQLVCDVERAPRRLGPPPLYRRWRRVLHRSGGLCAECRHRPTHGAGVHRYSQATRGDPLVHFDLVIPAEADPYAAAEINMACCSTALSQQLLLGYGPRPSPGRQEVVAFPHSRKSYRYDFDTIFQPSESFIATR